MREQGRETTQSVSTGIDSVYSLLGDIPLTDMSAGKSQSVTNDVEAACQKQTRTSCWRSNKLPWTVVILLTLFVIVLFSLNLGTLITILCKANI